MKRSLESLTERLCRTGLNLVGATRIADYDAAVPASLRLQPQAPGVRTAIVVGHGGASFWESFRAAGAIAGPDPLDAFTRRAVEHALAPIAGDETLLFPFPGAWPRASFVHLAAAAGLGRPSLVGVLIHPEFGPWIALRAALLVPSDVAAPRPADGFDPCGTCATRPCIAACPVGAVGPQGWDVARCADHRVSADDACGGGCHARLACPWGAAHRLPAEALAFHQAAARRAMAAARSSTVARA